MDTSVGIYVRKLREGRSMSLQKLAAALPHGDRGLLSRIESNKQTPSLLMAHEIALFFSTTPPRLVDGELVKGRKSLRRYRLLLADLVLGIMAAREAKKKATVGG